MSRRNTSAPSQAAGDEPKIVIDLQIPGQDRRAIQQSLASTALTLGLGAGWTIRLSSTLVYERPQVGSWSWRILLRSPDGHAHQVVLVSQQDSLQALPAAVAECAGALNGSGGRRAPTDITDNPVRARGRTRRARPTPPRRRR
jgi:hypothetical protein